MTRLYDPTPFMIGHTIVLHEHAHRHLNVLRLTVNDSITLFNGDGNDYTATITELTKKESRVTITQAIENNTESPVSITLAQSLPKGDKMDYIVQKAVELGVTSITPIIAERSQGRLSKEQEQKKVARLQTIAIAACEQCGRSRIPTITSPLSLADWLQLTDHTNEQRYILSPSETTSASFSSMVPPKTIALLVGPEGGFTHYETELAAKHRLISLQLGNRVLRTETASLAAISIMQWCFGDFTNKMAT